MSTHKPNQTVNKQADISKDSEIHVVLKPNRWFAKKSTAILSDCSLEGATIIAQCQLKVGQKISLCMSNEFIHLRRIPAEVVAANINISADSKDYRYTLKFDFSNVPAVAIETVKSLLKNLEHEKS